MSEYDKLRTWATVRQLEFIEAIEKHGTMSKAEKAMKLSEGLIMRSMRSLKLKAAQMGYSPQHDMTKTVPDGYMVRGVSTYYDQEGKPRGQWVKSAIDEKRQSELIKAAIDELASSVKGLSPLVDAPSHSNSDLMTVYPFGDPHIGLYAWAQEAGADFDLQIAERLTLGAVDRLVTASPASDTAVILPLGDVFHINDQTNTTPAHKHQLDADGRFVKVLQVGVKTFKHAILRALEKHQNVVVRFVRGNHDPQAVWALAVSIAEFFSNNPRVRVDLSPADHWFLRWGKCLIGATHGDKSKHEQLMGVMACDRAQDWGETLYRYWYCGHLHHSLVKEFPGVTVEVFRTLAASDAHGAGHGYRAGRDMRAIVLHREYGEIERHRCDIGMLK